MNNRKIIAIVGAALLAIIGTVVIVIFVQSAEDRALEGEELVTVLTVQARVPAGTQSSQLESFVEVERIPTKIAPDGVIADLVQVQGLVNAVDLFPGEVLLAQRFVEAERFAASRGTVEVPEGLLEVTMALSQEQFVGGIAVPGDTIALIVNGSRSDFISANLDSLAQETGADGTTAAANARFTKIILQQALVTNVQGNPLPESPQAASASDRVAPASGSLLVTLALSGPDVERLLYVRNSQSLNANLHLALHHGDAQVVSEGISVENIVNPEAPVG